MEISGTQDAIVEIAEQLAWLGAAFQEPSPHASGLSLITPIVKPDARTTDLGPRGIVESSSVFTIESKQEYSTNPDTRSPLNGTCWHALFRNPVVVKGFPVPFRSQNEIGLELSLESMAFLAETPFATRYDDSLVLKGFSTMFFPTGRVADSVMWHFLHDSNGSYLPYYAFKQHHIKYCGIGIAGFQQLETAHTRNFVGWTSAVTRRLGMSTYKWSTFMVLNAVVGMDEDDLYENIDRAGVDLCTPGCDLEKVSISVSKIVSIGGTISRQTANKPILTASPTYIHHVMRVRKWTFLIYDTETFRGWLVDGASALLHIVRTHIVQTQLAMKRYFPPQNITITGFHYPAASRDPDAAMGCLLNKDNWPIALMEHPESYVIDDAEVGKVVPEKNRV